MSIAYFAHELADAAVQRRLAMLKAAGNEVTLFGFDRVRGPRPSGVPEGAQVLGRTRNQAFAQRVTAVAGALPRAVALRRLWGEADVIVARNLEMLALVIMATRLTGRRQRIVYECLDIHRLMLDPGPAGAALRALERACLKRVALVVTSSPAFERQHFRGRQHYRGPIAIAENKVLALEPAPAADGRARRGEPPWTIAWCGILRCRRSFEVLCDLARTHADLVRIELWGAPALDQIPGFHQAVAERGNVRFNGAYSAADLAAIYGESHFAWAIDFYEAGGNSDMLLPNRLYESLAFGAVPIAIANVETARWLEANGVGVVLTPPVETALPRFIDGLGAAQYHGLQGAVARLEPELIRATPQSCRAFAAQIVGAA